jgi:uncharacterized protein (DUF2267 family)
MRRTTANNTTPTGLHAMAAAMLLAMASTIAAKEPQTIRQHLMEDPDKSVTSVDVEPHHGEALDGLVDTKIWKVEYTEEGEDGESLIFMAVHDGEVLRIHDFNQPRKRDNFLKLLPEGFRVQSGEDARKLVAATLELYFGFPFSEPELTVDEMRMDKVDGEYFFVDGERFSDATGYRITTDAEGRVTAYEYSWELPVEPLED